MVLPGGLEHGSAGAGHAALLPRVAPAARVSGCLLLENCARRSTLPSAELTKRNLLNKFAGYICQFCYICQARLRSFQASGASGTACGDHEPHARAEHPDWQRSSPPAGDFAGGEGFERYK